MMYVQNGMLHLRKVNVPDMELNITNDIHASYRKFLTSTIYKDMRFLQELIRVYVPSCELSVRVGDLNAITYDKTQTKGGRYYYPVYGTFCVNGQPTSPEFEIVKIPFMQVDGKLNINGNNKVLLMIQRSAEDVSFNMKKKIFNIAMPFANIRIACSNRGIKMMYGNRRFNMHDVIRAMLYREGIEEKLEEIFVNTHLIGILDLNPYISNEAIHGVLESNTKGSINSPSLLDKIYGEQYELGQTRVALNESLTLYRAEGYTLSRPAGSLQTGTLLTRDNIAQLIRERVNCVYVECVEFPDGYCLADEVPKIYTYIPAGLRNCTLLRKRFPEYADQLTIPVDIHLSANDAIGIPNNRPITREEVEFLIVCGHKTINVHTEKSKTIVKFSFEREIVGNYTARLRELTTHIPAGRNADDWVYFYNNPDLEYRDDTHLNSHDMIAIVSVLGEILLTGKTTLLDRDTAFLKKILLPGDLLSETLRSVLQEFVTKYKVTIQNAILGKKDPVSLFWTLTSKWYSKMNAEKYLAAADTINLSAEISQICHVVTPTSADAEIVDEQRHLAMPFYGRICPFETPAGKKLGMVNTKSIACRIKNNLPYAPYYKVLASGNGIRISKKVTWMSVKDEIGNKFGDLLSLKQDSNGNYINNYILARVPNPDISDEHFIFKNIKAYDLAGGYVAASPEQFISPTVALVPGACSDDAVRISYGSSQIRQSLYLYNSERPGVVTPMYSEMVSCLDSEKYISPCNGKVISIDNEMAVLQDRSGRKFEVPIQNPGDIGKLDITIELYVKAGDNVSDGQKIAEAFSYPQVFAIKAPYDGIVKEITADTIVIDKSGVNSEFTTLDNIDSIRFDNGRIRGQSAVFLNLHVSVGEHVKKGQILADTYASREGLYTPTRDALIGYNCEGYNYEDGVVAVESAAVKYTSVIAHHIDHLINKKNYPYSNTKLSSGFKYCRDGDTVATVFQRKKITDKDGHKRYLRATAKSTGIPFEITTLENDGKMRHIAIHMLGFNKLRKGDKMSGFHGNKGVVSQIYKDSEAPQLMNGMVLDIINNPLGVPSRMNIGQILHVHLGLISHVLGIYLDSPSYNGASIEDTKTLMRLAYHLANDESIGDNVTKQYNRQAFNAVFAKFPNLPPELPDLIWPHIENVIDWRGTFDEEGNAEVYDPQTDTFFEGKMTIGFAAYNKLMQEADEKMNVRSGPLEEAYARISGQPQKNLESAKGQRMAEMEFMALVAAGASEFIREILNEKSDNAGLRTNRHMEQLGMDLRVNDQSCYSRAVENLLYLLEGCGVQVEAPKDIVDIGIGATRMKEVLNFDKAIKEEFSVKYSSESSSGMPKSEKIGDLYGVDE